jgi:hypothetical protein
MAKRLFKTVLKRRGTKAVASEVCLLTVQRISEVKPQLHNSPGTTSGFLCTGTDGSANTFTKASHGLANGDKVKPTNVGAVTGITVNTEYYVVGVSGSAFQLALTLGGAAIDITYSTGTKPTFRLVATYVDETVLQYQGAADGLKEYQVDETFGATLVDTTLAAAVDKIVRLPVETINITTIDEERGLNTADMIEGTETDAGEELLTMFGISTTLDQLMSLDAEALCSASTIASDTQTSVTHGLVNGDQVYLTNLGSVTGTGLAAGSTYFIVEKTTDTFKLSLISGGAAIDLTGADTTPVTYRKVITNTLADDDAVVFTDITGGTGLVANKIYYVVSATASKFKLSATKGGSAINFTSDVTAGTLSAAGSTTIKVRRSPGSPTQDWVIPLNATAIAAVANA